MLGFVVCGSRTWMWTMAAPAFAASMAEAAMACGVTGTAGLREGVSAEPVTAQAIITFRCIMSLSLDAQMRVVHHFAPLDDLGLDARAELLRLVGHRHEAELEQLRLHLGLGHRRGDLLLQQVDDRLRRSLRRQHAGERIGLLVGIAGLSHGRHIGDLAAALEREHRERAQLAVLDVGVCPPMVAAIAGAAPANGTCVRSRSNFCLNNSPDRCGVEPMPGPANVYLPGLDLISAMSSLTFFAGTDGLTTSTFGE